MKYGLALLTTSISLALLAGCNNDNTENTENTENTAIKYGVFVDSPVAGLKYKTTTQTGFTDENGRFQYIAGEEITFSIGATELPPVIAGETITPLDVFDTQDVNDTQVVNTIRLLQSIDNDGDPDNNIVITEEMHQDLSNHDFDLTSETFEQDSSAELSDIGVTLVSKEQALEHFTKNLPYSQMDLTGDWFEIWGQIPVPSTNSAIDVIENSFSSIQVDEDGNTFDRDVNTGMVSDESEFAISLTEKGKLRTLDAEFSDYMPQFSQLSSAKDKLAYLSPLETELGDNAGEFGLMIKLAKDATISDLEGTWFSLGLEFPKQFDGQQDLPLAYIDQLSIDADGKATLNWMFDSDNTVEHYQFSLNGENINMEEIFPVYKDGMASREEQYALKLAKNKDVMLLGYDAGDNWGMATMMKQAVDPKISDFAGSWTMYTVVTSPLGQLNAEDFAYQVEQIEIDAEGNIQVNFEHDTGEAGEGLLQPEKIRLTDQGFAVSSDLDENNFTLDDFNVLVINEGRDFMMNARSVSDEEQSYSFAIKKQNYTN